MIPRLPCCSVSPFYGRATGQGLLQRGRSVSVQAQRSNSSVFLFSLFFFVKGTCSCCTCPLSNTFSFKGNTPVVTGSAHFAFFDFSPPTRALARARSCRAPPTRAKRLSKKTFNGILRCNLIHHCQIKEFFFFLTDAKSMSF